ncbi:MAG: phloretin hydrolase [Lachnospiraceae bacterium]|nr:phloretin hydrolase [Lachnospiraceae bacterium]
MNAPKVPLHAGDEEKSYYHFYQRELTPMSAEKAEFLNDPWQNDGNGLEISQRNTIFDDGYLPGETGLFTLKEGGFQMANLTRFEGCTGSMLQWWFAWHSLDSLRYSIWDPYDHYGIQVSDEDRAYILDPNTSIPDKCRNIVHCVSESLVPGTPPDDIVINFKAPATLGFDDSKVYTDKCSFIVCSNVKMGPVPVVMLHMARDTDYGCELRSRFWVGYQVIEGKGQYLLPDEIKDQVKGMLPMLLNHNFLEFSNLAAILPEVHAQEKDNW